MTKFWKRKDFKYRKIPKISPGAYIFQRPFLGVLILEWLIFVGAYLWREICVSKQIGLALQLEVNLIFSLYFTLYLRAIFQVKAPGGLILTEGFLRYRFGGLIFRGAYFRNFTVSNSLNFSCFIYLSNGSLTVLQLLWITGHFEGIQVAKRLSQGSLKHRFFYTLRYFESRRNYFKIKLQPLSHWTEHIVDRACAFLSSCRCPCFQTIFKICIQVFLNFKTIRKEEVLLNKLNFILITGKHAEPLFFPSSHSQVIIEQKKVFLFQLF